MNRPIPRSRRGAPAAPRQPAQALQQRAPSLARDWQAMGQVLRLLRRGALRLWGEIGRTT